MKTVNSKTSVLLAIVFILAITATSFKSNDQASNKYLTMVITQNVMWKKHRILIIDEQGKNEEIVLEEMGEKNYLQNYTTINQTINSIATRGYELISVNDNKYTFVKK